MQIKNCIAFVADQINLFNQRKTASNCFPLENLLGMNLYKLLRAVRKAVTPLTSKNIVNKIMLKLNFNDQVKKLREKPVNLLPRISASMDGKKI